MIIIVFFLKVDFSFAAGLDDVLIGYIKPSSINYEANEATFTLSLQDPDATHLIPEDAKSAHYCNLIDETFNNDKCSDFHCKDFSITSLDRDVIRLSLDKEDSFSIECNKKSDMNYGGCVVGYAGAGAIIGSIIPFFLGPIVGSVVGFIVGGTTCSGDGCDGTGSELEFIVCDSNYDGAHCEAATDPYNRNHGSVNLDLARTSAPAGGSYSYQCIKLEKVMRLRSADYNNCKDEEAIRLRAVNQLEPCGDEEFCVNGVCTNYYCEPDGVLHEHEQCDPDGDQLFRVNGQEISGEEITCGHFKLDGEPLYPRDADDENKPVCSSQCTLDLSNCITQEEYKSLVCGNFEIDHDVGEACDWHEPGEHEYEHPIGLTLPKGILLAHKAYCGEKEGYIGDALMLDCSMDCQEVIYDFCVEDKLEIYANESDCTDGLNDNFWYVMENPHAAIGNEGYFDISRVRYNTTGLCLNSTHCTDCQDFSCDLREGRDIHGEYGICNFREELFCNDGFDNNGNGLVDLDDPACSDIPRYNPEQSATGYCNVNYQCYLDRDSVTGRTKELCYKAGEMVWDMSGEFICTPDSEHGGFWASPLKAMAGVFFSVAGQSEFSIYCNDYGDSNEGYVIAYNSKSPGGMTAGDLLRMSGNNFGKFCAFTSGESWGVSAKIKEINEENTDENIKKRIQSSIALFSQNRLACDEAAEDTESYTIAACNDNNVFFNAKYGTAFMTNSNIEGTPVLSGTEMIADAIEQLDPVGTFVDIPHIRHGAKTEAFVWKIKGAKEIIGAIEEFNGTVYAMILYKNIQGFEKMCEDSLQMVRISSNVMAHCTGVGDGRHLIHWSFPLNSAELQASKAKFNELVRDIKIS
jgi:hypothetical protein